jgi:hypothetical protein
LAGASFAAIVAICCLADVHEALWWSLLCFAISLPSSLSLAMLARRSIALGLVTPLGRCASSVLGPLTYGLTILGTGLLLLHISGIVGGVFLFSSVLAVIFDVFLFRTNDRIGADVEKNMPEVWKERSEYLKEDDDQSP